MKFITNLKSTTGILGIATITMAGLVAACDQQAASSGLVEKSDDGACVVTRLAQAKAASPENAEAECNPCAASNPCAAENPCAPKGCNPCAASNPCAAENPCAPKGCNPCAVSNPCAASNPCNPCAASNPCAGANPCNPCAPGNGGKELSPDEATAAYDCFKDEMRAGYGKSGENGASDYQDFTVHNTSPYVSFTHGGRNVNNYANDVASAYARYEDAGPMPVGAIIAKDSFVVGGKGKTKAGPLFLMEKMEAGFMPDYNDWKYTMIMPDGSTWGVTKGKNSSGMQFCIDCHVAAEDYDYLFFLPDEFRKE